MNIYLVFSKTGTLLSRVIRLFTKEKYVHASISLDENLNTMYSFGRINPDNPFSGGFAKESLSEGVYKKYKNCECVVYRIAISEEQYAYLVRELAVFLASRQSFRYNFLGLFAAALKIPYKRQKYYFCSQFVSELLIKINVLNSENPPELIKTMELLEMEPKVKVFEGYTWEYVECMA